MSKLYQSQLTNKDTYSTGFPTARKSTCFVLASSSMAFHPTTFLFSAILMSLVLHNSTYSRPLTDRSSKLMWPPWSQPLTSPLPTSWTINYMPSWTGMPQLHSARCPGDDCLLGTVLSFHSYTPWSKKNGMLRGCGYAPDWLSTNRFSMLWSTRSLALLTMLSIAQR